MRAAESPATAPTRRQRVRTGGPRNGGLGVNGSLTPRTPRETTDVAAGIARMIRGLSRRAEAGDLAAITALRELDQVVSVEALRAAHALNVVHGYTWAEIGRATQLSRQGAQQRWGNR